jgi:prepilin-type N-terminal cleavage/methylation domain-containing protein
MRRKGFSLVELMIAITILLISLLTFFMVNQSTSSRSMESYYKYMAYSLGNEVINYCQGMGYQWAKAHKDTAGATKPFPLNDWHKVVDNLIFTEGEDGEELLLTDTYFSECNIFERKVEFKEVKIPATNGSRFFNGIRVIVNLRMKSNRKISNFLKSGAVKFASTIMEVKP